VKNKVKVQKIFLNIFIPIILIFSVFVGTVNSESNIIVKGFDKGPSYTSVIPIKKTTFVGFDEDSYLDDYAYLAGVPTAVFNDGDKLYSHPLLFYQDELDIEEERELTLDARKGIDYFMEDWMSYCNGKLDQMTLINVPKNKMDSSWKAKEYTVIQNNSPCDIAAELALDEWSYSDKAVIAVIQDSYEDSDYEFSNELEGTMPTGKVISKKLLDLKQTNSLNPIYESFTVEEKYKFLKAEIWWDGLIFMGKMIPTGDPDLQLYCKQKDGGWMQAIAVSGWNVYHPIGHEYAYSYVYKPGDWRIGITDFPTEGEEDAPTTSAPGGFITFQGSGLEIIRNLLFKPVIYHADVDLYPGIDLEIPDVPCFGCRDAEFKLAWDIDNVDLGLTIIGPGGEVIYSDFEKTEESSKTIEIHQLGECLEGEHYKISVFALSDITKPINFKLTYGWQQNFTKDEADGLSSATEGAVLASSLNAPLLYAYPNELPVSTREVLYKLGVNSIYLIDLNSHLLKETKNKIKDISEDEHYYNDLATIYSDIREMTDSNDVIFSTIDPWTKWYLAEFKPDEETTAGLYIGPAAYIAAHHGTPVILVDNHPRLSSAVVWHNEFWRRFVSLRDKIKPSVAEMTLTGKRIWSFLEDHGFDREGRETLITVAGQYEIGMPWDRMFVGIANSGRICGTPVDSAYWISRNVFYPTLIFENPALQGKNDYITGSESSRDWLNFGLLKYPYLSTLVIDKQSRNELFEYAILCSFVTHKYRFNERASKFYGSLYQGADGLTPGEDTTMEPIDQGVNKKFYDLDGMYYPDICESEVIPFYLEKGGYGAVFSTKLECVVDNLNTGVLLWIHTSHGIHGKGGQTLFWDPQTGFSQRSEGGTIIDKIVNTGLTLFSGIKKEENPWRGYDWYLGSTEEPDTMSSNIQGHLLFTNIRLPFYPATGMDNILARKPIKEKIPTLIRDFLNWITPFRDPFDVDDLYDGVTGTLGYSKYPLDYKNSGEIESNLENLHCSGFMTSICQTSNTYFHLMLVRHGSVFQVQDPWPTSWYAAVWRQSIPRDIILGNTVGEAYTKGMSHVSPLYLGGGKDVGPQWWWDDGENVIYFGDPDLRMYVPNTEYSDANHWEKPDSLRYREETIINGHMPFGATSYPNEKQEMTILGQYLYAFIALALILVLIIIIRIINRSKPDDD